MVKDSLEKEKKKKQVFEVKEVVKKLKSLEKSPFLQIFCKCYDVVEVVITSNIIRRGDKNAV
jgi:hypothetical protein